MSYIVLIKRRDMVLWKSRPYDSYPPARILALIIRAHSTPGAFVTIRVVYSNTLPCASEVVA